MGEIQRSRRSGGDQLDGVDPDVSALDDRFTVRRAGVIDESRLVPLERRVHARATVQDEEKSVMTLHRGVVVAAIGFGVRDLLADVFDDPRAFGNVLEVFGDCCLCRVDVYVAGD